MGVESLDHLVVVNVVEEDAVAYGADGDGGAEHAVSGLENGSGRALEQRAVELWVVHGETGAREEVQETLVVGVREMAAGVGESGGEGHVDGDGMPVTKGCLGNKLMKRRPSKRCQHLAIGKINSKHRRTYVWP